MKHYVILCVVVAATVMLTILFVPGFAESLESELLTFLSRNAK